MIEILVVIVILGILAAITSINVRTSLVKSRDATRKSDLNSIQKALELYQNDHGAYPVSNNGNIQNNVDTRINWGEAFVDGTGSVYMNELPADPRINQSYCYTASDPPTSYQLYANLENINDRNCLTSACASTITCGSILYNYGVSSSNILATTPIPTPVP